jgi:gamma-glutamylcyclotransferase (GGCT)/AIG2-like uncharacterized protein YtfP
MHEYVPLFIYDNMKKGFQQDEYLKGAKFLGKGYTITNKYYMNITLGNGNAVTFTEDNPESLKKGKIRGEVYAVRPDAIIDIDMFHQNGIMYDRELRNIVLSQQEIKSTHKTFNPTRRCWMYLGKWEHWRIFNTSTAMMTKGPNGVGDYYDFMNPHRWNREKNEYQDYMMW